MKFLLDAGADATARDILGRTPLHMRPYAEPGHGYTLFGGVDTDYESLISTLLTAGAELDARDHQGQTPLHTAARYDRRARAVPVLLAAGADVQARDDRGSTPLHGAARGGVSVVRALLDAGADPASVDEDGYTPLHRVATDSREADPEGSVSQVLLEAGASIEARSENGETPLHLAASGGHARVLIEWARILTPAPRTIAHRCTERTRWRPGFSWQRAPA